MLIKGIAYDPSQEPKNDTKKYISKQVEKLMNMGGFPEEKHKTEEKRVKAAQPCYEDLAVFFLVVKQ